MSHDFRDASAVLCELQGTFEASAKKKRAALRRLAAFLRYGNKMISPQHVRECVFAIKKCLEDSVFMESYRTRNGGDGGAEPTGAHFTWPPSDDDFVDAAAATAAVTGVGRVDDDCRLVTEAARAIAALAPHGEHICPQAASGNASSLDSLTEGEEDEAEAGDSFAWAFLAFKRHSPPARRGMPLWRA